MSTHKQWPRSVGVRVDPPDEADWEAACKLDESTREFDLANGKSGVWLHKSRTPLRMAMLVPEDERMPLFAERGCSSGYCWT